MLNWISRSKWFIIGLLSIFFLSLAIFYICSYIENNTERIKAIISVFSAYAVSGSLLLNAYSIFSQIKENKLSRTFQTLDRWDDSHFMDARDNTRQHQDAQQQKSQEQITQEIEGDEDLKRSVNMVLNYFEGIEDLIRHKMIDEDIVMEHFAHMIKDILDRYKGYLNKKSIRNPLGIKMLIKLHKRVDKYISNLEESL